MFTEPTLWSASCWAASARAGGARRRPPPWGGTAFLVLAAFLVPGCGGSNGQESRPPEAGPAAAPQAVGEPGAPRPAPTRGKAWVIFDGDTVVAELAATPEERQRGLMYRTELPAGSGMLFVFEEEQELSFWMKDTYIPLDIAFIDAAGRIVDIQHMRPQTENLHTSAAPAIFALEVPLGWFAAHDVNVGDTAQILFGPR